MDCRRRQYRSRRSRLVAGRISPWLPILVSLVVVLAVGYVASRPKGSDQDQVVAALDESIKASKEGKPGGVLEQLSSAFAVNNQNVSSGEIAKAVREFKPAVEVLQPKPLISGDEAHVTSPVILTVSFMGQSQSYTVKGVDLAFHREISRAWYIFPVPKWRLTHIQVPTDALTQIQGLGFGGM